MNLKQFTMKKFLIIISGLLISLVSFSQKQFVVDANAEMRSLTGSFTKIKVSHAIDLYLSQSDNESIAISASEDKFKAGIKTVVEGNTLRIYFDGDKVWNGRNRKMKAYVSFKTLESLEASGASDIVVAGKIRSSALKLNLSGASDFKGEIDTDMLDLDLSGASDVTISGRAKNVNIESSGASDVKGYSLETEICKARASGASDINISVVKELTAHASGASSINYQGSPVLKESQTSGASSVSRKRS
jgi:hypothetical protein